MNDLLYVYEFEVVVSKQRKISIENLLPPELGNPYADRIIMGSWLCIRINSKDYLRLKV